MRYRNAVNAISVFSSMKDVLVVSLIWLVLDISKGLQRQSHNLTIFSFHWKPWETNQARTQPLQQMALDCDEEHVDAKPYGIEVGFIWMQSGFCCTIASYSSLPFSDSNRRSFMCMLWGPFSWYANTANWICFAFSIQTNGIVLALPALPCGLDEWCWRAMQIA